MFGCPNDVKRSPWKLGPSYAQDSDPEVTAIHGASSRWVHDGISSGSNTPSSRASQSSENNIASFGKTYAARQQIRDSQNLASPSFLNVYKEDTGTAHYQQGKYKEANESFTSRYRSIQYIKKKLGSSKSIDMNEVNSLNIRNLLNLALVNLKLKNYGLVIRYCDEILELQPNNEKALFRKASALFESGCIDQAYHVALQLDPSDQDCRKLRYAISKARSQLAITYNQIAAGAFKAKKTNSNPAASKIMNWISSTLNKITSFARF